MKTRHHGTHSSPGFTLVEVLITSAIAVTTIGLAMGIFLSGLRMMYFDSVRLQTNSNLRYFLAHISTEALDASEFYLLPSYEKLDGSVSLAADVSTTTADVYGTDIAHGDCIVLVARTSSAANSPIKRLRIYYRLSTVADRDNLAPIRYYDSGDVTGTGPHVTTADLEALLNAVNLTNAKQITAQAKGRKIPASVNSYPIFSSESPMVSATNESFTVNTEIVQGSASNKTFTSSSFNYMITPRR
jgi:hypothetical protein